MTSTAGRINVPEGSTKDCEAAVLKFDNNRQFVSPGSGNSRNKPQKKHFIQDAFHGIMNCMLEIGCQGRRLRQDSESAPLIREFQAKKIKEMIACPNKM